MNKTTWLVAFLITSSAAAALGVATYRRWNDERTKPPAPRSIDTVSDVELNLMLNKIREGDLHAIKGDLDAAKRAWADASRQGDGLWQIHEGVGDSYYRAGLAEDAVREYAKAEPLVPASMRENLRGIRYKRGMLLGAKLEAFEILLDLNDPLALLTQLVWIYEQCPAKDKMMKLLRDRAKEDPRVHAVIAKALEKTGDPNHVVDLAIYAQTCEPWNASLNRSCVAGLAAQKKFGEAVAVCRAWTRAEPQNLEAWKAMGDVWRQAGNDAQAFVAYSSIVDVRPGDADAHRLLGRALLEMNRVDDAIAAFEKSKKLRPEEPDRWIELADAVARKDAAAAERMYDDIAKSKWDARFGGVVATVKSRMAQRYVVELEDARKRGDVPRTRELRRVLADYGVPDAAYDIKVIMTWDTKTDIDMDVVEPSGEQVHHGHAGSKAGSKYWVDNTQGHGPETYTLAKAPAGKYKIGAHYHSGSGKTTVKFTIILFEETDRERRIEQELIFEKSGEQKFLAEVEIQP